MKAQFVFEKFSVESDPIHDMGIGDPLMRASGALQKYAEENGYEFEMKKISKVESPTMTIPIKQVYDTVPLGSYTSHAPCMYTDAEFTITYMKHRMPTPFSLRKNWIGYKYELQDEDYLEMPKDVEVKRSYKEWELNILKKHLKKGDLKKSVCKQNLMGRYGEISEIIDRIDKNVQKIIKK